MTLLARDQWGALPLLPGLSHLALDLSDIAAPREGHVLAGAEHMEALLQFAASWDREAPLLIHCYAGVSRSTAACFALCCALDPDADEQNLAWRLRAASPSATPNPRLVALADRALHRSGRMIEAIRTIGRGSDCFEGEVFHLDILTPAIPPR